MAVAKPVIEMYWTMPNIYDELFTKIINSF